ncbi:MAG: nuclear transport factor 2 family protein [Polyangiaceae bacterium]|nr:nuclear transport factor 2 family protein [Polyangiaceae bacterium]
MTEKVPRVLADYFAATNAHDVERMLAAFTNDATVRDEGRDHVGVTAIRAWMNETIEKYDYRVEPIEASRDGSTSVVLVWLRGKFPRSPITLQYAFTISGERVTRLEIG